jgi:phosphonatase-like hydrolase
MAKIKLIVFDMAGTTVHDEMYVSKAVAAAMNEFGYAVQPIEVQPIMGYEKPLAISMLLDKHEPNTQLITDEYISQIHSRFVTIMMNFYRTSPDVRPLDGVENVLKQLRELGILIGLDTGFSKDIADLIVSRLGWLESGLIQYVVASDEVPAGRPEPYMIYKMMDAAGITDPKQVVKVGDTEVDINEGRNAQCLYSIAVTTGAYTRAALEPYNPDFILDSLSGLIPIVERYQFGLEV